MIFLCWNLLGNVNVDTSLDESKEDEKTFFYQKRYDPISARFEDPLPEPDITDDRRSSHKFCPFCFRGFIMSRKGAKKPVPMERLEEKKDNTFHFGMVKYGDEEFRVGNAVYLQPGTLQFKNPPPPSDPKVIKKENVDEDMFPEYYRKSNDRPKGSNFDTPEPLEIGYITSIYSTTSTMLLAGSNLYLMIKKMYRPENTHRGVQAKERTDFNELFWSEEGEFWIIKIIK